MAQSEVRANIHLSPVLLAEPLLWSMSELSALIVCSCLPTLRQTMHRIPWLNRLLMPGCKLSSDRADRYSKSSFGASRFFFNRRVRYGRSTGCSGDRGMTEVGTCPRQTNFEDKSSSSSKHHHKGPTATTTEAAEGQPIPKRHLAPPQFWSRYGPWQPMNLQSGMQSNLEASSIRDIKNRASQSTDYVPSRSEPSELWHDLNFGNAKSHLYDERHSGMRIIAIEGQEFDQMSDLDPLERETEGYYTGKPQHAEPCLPAPVVLRDGRTIPPIKTMPAIGHSACRNKGFMGSNHQLSDESQVELHVTHGPIAGTT